MDEARKVPGAPGTFPLCVTSTVGSPGGKQGTCGVRRESRMKPALRAEAKCGNKSQRIEELETSFGEPEASREKG